MPHKHEQCQRGGVKSSVLSLRDFLQDRCIQCRVGDCLPEMGVFLLQSFPPRCLRQLQLAILAMSVAIALLS